MGHSAGPSASPRRPLNCSPARPSSQFLPRCPGPERPCLLCGLGREVRAGPSRGSPERFPPAQGPAPAFCGNPRGRGKRSKLPGEPALGAPGPRLRLPPGPELTSLKGAGQGPARVGSGLRAGPCGVGRRTLEEPRRAERQRSRPRGGGGEPPGYVAAIAAAARPLPTRPPTRPLAAGSCTRLLFPGRTESGSVSPRRTLAASPFPPLHPSRGHSCSPVPRRAALRRAGERSGGGGKGLRTRGAHSTDPARASTPGSRSR